MPLSVDHPYVTSFDRVGDAAIDRLRGHRSVDRLFYLASEAGNHSLLWHGLAWAQALATRDLKPAIRTSLALGMESALVNGPIKSAFRRDRPAFDGLRPHRLRKPRTSSFPSGHATSAFFAVRLLSATRLGRRCRPALYGTASVVALSRAYVRIHHASDVIVGAAMGDALGRVAQRVIRRTTST